MKRQCWCVRVKFASDISVQQTVLNSVVRLSCVTIHSCFAFKSFKKCSFCSRLVTNFINFTNISPFQANICLNLFFFIVKLMDQLFPKVSDIAGVCIGSMIPCRGRQSQNVATMDSNCTLCIKSMRSMYRRVFNDSLVSQSITHVQKPVIGGKKTLKAAVTAVKLQFFLGGHLHRGHLHVTFRLTRFKQLDCG